MLAIVWSSIQAASILLHSATSLSAYRNLLKFAPVSFLTVLMELGLGVGQGHLFVYRPHIPVFCTPGRGVSGTDPPWILEGGEAPALPFQAMGQMTEDMEKG